MRSYKQQTNYKTERITVISGLLAASWFRLRTIEVVRQNVVIVAAQIKGCDCADLRPSIIKRKNGSHDDDGGSESDRVNPMILLLACLVSANGSVSSARRQTGYELEAGDKAERDAVVCWPTTGDTTKTTTRGDAVGGSGND